VSCAFSSRFIVKSDELPKIEKTSIQRFYWMDSKRLVPGFEFAQHNTNRVLAKLKA
jgi:hypothetical protein